MIDEVQNAQIVLLVSWKRREQVLVVVHVCLLNLRIEVVLVVSEFSEIYPCRVHGASGEVFRNPVVLKVVFLELNDVFEQNWSNFLAILFILLQVLLCNLEQLVYNLDNLFLIVE